MTRMTVPQLSRRVAMVMGGAAAGAGALFPTASFAQVEEIIVTAERRAASVQDVPIAVSAFSDDYLEKNSVTSTLDLTKVTPGLNFTQSTQLYQPTIRGVGTRGISNGDESNVAVYIDGVYQPDLGSLNLDLEGVERVEVLKGPQGTVYGRNATGGAINIILKQASFDPEGHVAVTYGRFDHAKASARVTGPLSDTVAVQLMGSAMTEDGYYTNIVDGKTVGGLENYTGHASLRFEPSDKLDITIAYNGSYRDDRNTLNRNAPDGNTVAQAYAGAIIATQPYKLSLDTLGYLKVEHHGVSLKANYDFGPVTLSYLGSYDDVKRKSLQDTDVSSVHISNTQLDWGTESMIHDLLLTSNSDGRLSWIAGLNYFESDATLDLYSISPTSTFFRSTLQETKAYSGFVEATYEIVDNLFATAGARYTDEKRRYTNTTTPGVGPTGKDSWSNVTFHGSLRYDLGHTNVYASYSEGFKSGVFNGAAGTPDSADPETISAYEVGIKSNFSKRIRLNAAAYYYDYRDLQVSSSINATTVELQNSANSEIYGLDAELTFEPVDNLNFYVGVAWIHAVYKDFPGASATRPKPGSPPPGNMNVIEDASGNRMIRTPKYTFNVGADWTVPVGGGELTLAGNVFQSGKVYTDILNVFPIEPLTLVSASATWKMNDHVSFILSGDNLAGEKGFTHTLQTTSGLTANYYRPRFVSFTARYDF